MCIYISMYAPPPPGPTFFSISLTVSLQGQPFAICYLPQKKCIGEPSPLPPSQSRSPKTVFCLLCLFSFLFLFCSRIWSLELIQINPSQSWYIWPLRHHVSIKWILHKPWSKKYCMLNMRRYSLGMCNFPFRFGLWECKNSPCGEWRLSFK